MDESKWNALSLPKAYEQIKKDHPDTSITLNGLRSLVRSGQLAAVFIGKKPLISTYSIEALFTKGTVGKNETGAIRAIPER